MMGDENERKAQLWRSAEKPISDKLVARKTQLEQVDSFLNLYQREF